MEEVAFEMDVTLGRMLGGTMKVPLFRRKGIVQGKQRRGEVWRSKESESVAGHIPGWWLEVCFGPYYRGV